MQDLAHALPVLAGLAEVTHRFLFLRRGPDRDVDGTAIGATHLWGSAASSLTQEALLAGQGGDVLRTHDLELWNCPLL